MTNDTQEPGSDELEGNLPPGGDDDAVDVVDDVTEHSDKELALRFSW